MNAINLMNLGSMSYGHFEEEVKSEQRITQNSFLRLLQTSMVDKSDKNGFGLKGNNYSEFAILNTGEDNGNLKTFNSKNLLQKEFFTLEDLEQILTQSFGEFLTEKMIGYEQQLNSSVFEGCTKSESLLKKSTFEDRENGFTKDDLIEDNSISAFNSIAFSDTNPASYLSSFPINEVFEFLSSIGKAINYQQKIVTSLFQFQKLASSDELNDFFQGSKSLSLKLSPEHLGKLDVQIVKQDELTVVQLKVASDAKKIIETHINQIRDLFSNSTIQYKVISEKQDVETKITGILQETINRTFKDLNRINKKETTTIHDVTKTTPSNIGTTLPLNIGVPISQSLPLNQTQQFVLHVGKNLNEQQKGEQLLRQFQNIIGRSSLLQFTNGTSQLTIKLFPKHLGRLDVKLVQQEGIIIAKLMTTTKAAKSAIELQLHQLRQAFVGQNLQVEKIEITTQQQQQFNTEKEHQQEKQNNQEHKRKDENNTNIEAKNENENFKDFLEQTINLKV